MTASAWALDSGRLRAALSLYLVADPDQSGSGDVVTDTAAALAGGITCVQLRAKRLSDLEAYGLAGRLADLCRRHSVPFLVNDRVDVALAVQADGVHVGLSDLPMDVIRRLGNGRLLIGWSPETEEQVDTARAHGADYLGIGPVFMTGSKQDAGAAIGLDGLKRRAGRTDLPTVGIGGISRSTAVEVIRAGADGIAVISAILRTNAPAAAAADLRALVDDALAERSR